MIRIGALLTAFTMCLLLWHECGEDIAIFCYRIGCGAFMALRTRALIPVPVRTFARTRAACSRPSDISSMRCIAQRDFES
jgi:hypothetical protein